MIDVSLVDLIKYIVIICSLIGGSFFIITGSLGIVRFPDTYSRMHASGKCDTLGISLVLFGVIVYQGLDFVTVKLILILLFVFFTGPVAVNAIIHASFYSGNKMWTTEGWVEWSREEWMKERAEKERER
jgi:multicomponent Na+:H+ antiporter subunit G